MIGAIIGNTAEDGAMITAEWIQKHYIEQNLTTDECGKLLGITGGAVAYHARKFNLLKKDEFCCYKDPRFNRRIGLKYSDEWKQNIKLAQPHAKRVVRISKKGGRKVYNTITEAALENGLFRENVKKACQGKVKTSGGYKWEYLRTYGEEIVHRLQNLDFTLNLEQMMSGVYAGLPERMDKQEAANYYTKKLKICWKSV